MVATELDAENRILMLASFQNITFGELDGKHSARLDQVYAALSGAGFDVTVSNHIQQDMWQKWVQLSSLGAVTCLLRGTIGEIVSVPGGAETSLAALREAADIATACGFPPSPEFMKQKTADHTAEGSPLTASLYRDLKKNFPVEADSIVGDLITRGRSHNIPAPILQAAFVQLSLYSRRLASQ